MSIIDMLEKHRTSAISIALIIMVAFPFIQPIGLPFEISGQTQEYYDAINTLKSGDKAVIVIDVAPSAYTNVAYQTAATLYQLWSKGVKTVLWSVEPLSTLMVERIFNEPVAKPEGLQYGTDWVYLGYIPGTESAFASLTENLWGLKTQDHYGTAVSTLPISSTIQTIEECDLLMVMSYSSDGILGGVRQWTTEYPDIPYLVATTATNLHHITPYYPDVIGAMVIDLAGAAEYELLVSRPYKATALQDSNVTGQLVIVALIVLGNVALLRKKEGGKK
jgi:hypothetical protein